MFRNSNLFGNNPMLDVSLETEMARAGREDEYESMTEAMDTPTSGDDQRVPLPLPEQPPRPRKRSGNHRHTQRQTDEMEAFFKNCPHPDDKQRKALGRQLGLEPLQVKFWFQNKRTQLKAQHERQENANLKAENAKLVAENTRIKEAISSVPCNKCGGPPTHSAVGEMSFDEQQMRLENARLREEIDRMSRLLGERLNGSASYSNNNNNMPPRSVEVGGGSGSGNYGVAAHSHSAGVIGEILYGSSSSTGNGDHFLRSFTAPPDKSMTVELAVAAMEELTMMAKAGFPLWIPSNRNPDVLNEDEYRKTFPRGMVGPNPKPLGVRSEVSRQSVVVIMNYTNLVEILMNVNQWSTVFCGIVARASTLEVLSTGVAGNYNGALQVMSAEFQVPSPLVGTRQNYFVRYCKQLPDGIWAVVDAPLDNLRPAAAAASSISGSQRRPSGCLIQELPNGYSKVTWIEHVEVDDEREVHNIYRPLITSGLAFGARRWVATLERQCERLASSLATNIPVADLGLLISSEGRRSMMMLAERMVMCFSTGVGASTAHASWTTLPSTGMDDVRVMTRKGTDEPGRPHGIVLNAATSFWLPVPPKRIFDFLRDENSRKEWDILSNGGQVIEMAHIANGRDPGNCISLLRVNDANSSQSNMLILQESRTDSTGSYVVYAPVDIPAMSLVLNGGDSDYVALLPSGFAILPDGSTSTGGPITDVGSGGSLLTVAFQILVDSFPTAKISLGSVSTVNNLIKNTAERIKGAVMPDST